MKAFQLAALLYCLLFSNLSIAADKIEGRILKIDQEVFIYLNVDNRLLPLTALHDIDRLALQRLESGDFITGEGLLSRREARLSSLYFVGLQRLLGLWRSQDTELFEFRTYEDLRLYWPVNWTASKVSSPVMVKNYSYNLSPTSDAHWTMLLVDSDSVELARLKFINNTVKVELLDRDTGNIKHTFQLTQIALDRSTR